MRQTSNTRTSTYCCVFVMHVQTFLPQRFTVLQLGRCWALSLEGEGVAYEETRAMDLISIWQLVSWNHILGFLPLNFPRKSVFGLADIPSFRCSFVFLLVKVHPTHAEENESFLVECCLANHAWNARRECVKGRCAAKFNSTVLNWSTWHDKGCFQLACMLLLEFWKTSKRNWKFLQMQTCS